MEETPVPLRASVLIVSFNSAGPLRRCLTALEAAPDRSAFEVIVVDNGSQDESASLEPDFPAITFLKLPRNFGFTKAANIAMRTAKSELFFFVDPRVEVQGTAVTALAERLEAQPEAVALAPLLVTPAGEAVPQLFRLPRPEAVGAVASAGQYAAAGGADLTGDAVPAEFASLAALMVRGYFLKGLRYIDERYAQTWADAEIALQIRRVGKKTMVVPAVRCIMHPEPDVFETAPGRVRSLVEADWVTGAVTYATKHFGFGTGLKVRLTAALKALAGMRLGLVAGILGGRRLDGTQTVI